MNEQGLPPSSRPAHGPVPDPSPLLTRVLAAEARARRVGWTALGANLVIAACVAFVVALSFRDASPRRYVRAGTMLSTLMVDESTLTRDFGRVLQSYADAINEAVGPDWPALAKQTLDANAGMERAVRRDAEKRTDETFKKRREEIRGRLERELASALPPPTLTRARLDPLLEEYRKQVRQIVGDAAAYHARRSGAALEIIVRALPHRDFEGWGTKWTEAAARDLREVGEQFVEQHDGLAAADWAAEATR